MRTLTTSDLTKQQKRKFDSFVAQSNGQQVVIERHSGDPRTAWRYYAAKCRTHTDAYCIGRSNGCATSRGNYHSTWAVAYAQ
jgi:hypothetical protein